MYFVLYKHLLLQKFRNVKVIFNSFIYSMRKPLPINKCIVFLIQIMEKNYSFKYTRDGSIMLITILYFQLILEHKKNQMPCLFSLLFVL